VQKKTSEKSRPDRSRLERVSFYVKFQDIRVSLNNYKINRKKETSMKWNSHIKDISCKTKNYPNVYVKQPKQYIIWCSINIQLASIYKTANG
jgi:hypothetical protein